MTKQIEQIVARQNKLEADNAELRAQLAAATAKLAEVKAAKSGEPRFFAAPPKKDGTKYEGDMIVVEGFGKPVWARKEACKFIALHIKEILAV